MDGLESDKNAGDDEVDPVKIAVGGILHNRWTVPAYLDAMAALDTRGHTAQWLWAIDGAWHPLDLGLTTDRFPRLATVSLDCALPHYCREPGEKEHLHRVYSRLALLRNMLREATLDLDCDALLSVDSDILPPPETLQLLVNSGENWVGALVRNSALDPHCWNVFHLRDIETQGGLLQHFRAAGDGADGEAWPAMQAWRFDPRDPTQTQDLATGAVCLYRRPILCDARWEADRRGRQEDIGFAMNAARAGYRAAYMPIRCKHLTVDGEA
jgi:hypothetical protein